MAVSWLDESTLTGWSGWYRTVAIVERRTAHVPYERLHQSCLKKPMAMRTSLIDTNRFPVIK